MSGPGPIAGIDHVLVGVADLEAARRTFAHLGFTLSARGRHIGWGTANYCAMLRGGYIELLGIVDPAQFTNNLDRFLEGGEGLLGLAFATDDADAAARELAARGVPVDGPKALSRKLELPGGAVEPAFRLLHTAPAATAGIAAFVCQHLTPDLVWRDDWLVHPNGAEAIAAVSVAVADPGAAAIAFGTLFGPDAVSAGHGAVEVETGRGIVRLAAPDGLAPLFPGIASLPHRALPYLAGLRVRVADIETTAGHLDAAGVPAIRDGDRLLRLDLAHACGVLLEFEGD